MTRKKVSIWLDAETDDRAEALVPAIKAQRGYRHARVSRAFVLQLALDRGLEVLEREVESAAPPGAVVAERPAGVERLPSVGASSPSSDVATGVEPAAPGVAPVAPAAPPDAPTPAGPPAAGGSPFALTPEAMAALGGGLGDAIRASTKK